MKSVVGFWNLKLSRDSEIRERDIKDAGKFSGEEILARNFSRSERTENYSLAYVKW